MTKNILFVPLTKVDATQHHRNRVRAQEASAAANCRRPMTPQATGLTATASDTARPARAPERQRESIFAREIFASVPVLGLLRMASAVADGPARLRRLRRQCGFSPDHGRQPLTDVFQLTPNVISRRAGFESSTFVFLAIRK